jgi:acetyltransferase-like isoleucine patch superfamily enzyme
MFANGCFIGDASHRFDDPDLPVTWQGFTTKGPVRIGSNCWFGVNCVVTGGVTIGDRCVIGSNSVVTEDLPRGVIAAGSPARVIREIEFRPQGSGSQSQE